MIARVEKVLNSGVYGIKINNQIEVGYSNNIKHQWGKHRRALERTNHWNPKLQNAYNKYKNVEFFIIEECESWLPEKEKMWIELLNTMWPGGYNLTDRGKEIR